MSDTLVQNYNRQGNDCNLYDKVEIIREDGDIVIRHTHKASGWFGKDINTENKILRSMNANGIWIEVKQYLISHNLIDYIDFPLFEIERLF